MERFKRRYINPQTAFLRHATGVIHIGANHGQERDLYDEFGLLVLWIEPIPEVYERLLANIAGRRKHRAIQGLITDRDGSEYDFHISSNAGLSSSIYDLKLHREVWPHVTYVETQRLTSRTLPTLLREQCVDPAPYDCLVLDTQGSELLALRGAASLLPQFHFIITEVSDFELYEGCPQLPELADFLAAQGFQERSRREVGRHASGRHCYNIVYGRGAGRHRRR